MSDVRRGAAGQQGVQDGAFLPAGYGHPLHLDVVRVAEVLLNVVQLPAVLDIEAGDGAVVHLDAQGNPVVVSGQRAHGQYAEAQHEGEHEGKKLFHDGILLYFM